MCRSRLQWPIVYANGDRSMKDASQSRSTRVESGWLSLLAGATLLAAGLLWGLIDSESLAAVGLCYLSAFYVAIGGGERFRRRRKAADLPRRLSGTSVVAAQAERILAA